MDLVDAIIVRASVRKHLPLSRTGGQRFHGGVPYSSCVWSQDGVVAMDKVMTFGQGIHAFLQVVICGSKASTDQRIVG